MVRRGKILLMRSRWLQIAALVGFWWACEWLVERLALPLPGSVLGMFLLLALLLSGRLRTVWLRRGTASLLDHMVLFFVPAIMALMKHPELLGMLGLKILAVIVVGTLAVMVGTGLVVELFFRWSERDAR